MRNPFASPLWRNAAFARVWTAAAVSIFGPGTRLRTPAEVVIDVERDQPIGS